MEPRELWERNTRLAEAFCGSDDRVRQAQAVLDEAQAERARTLAAFAVTVGSDAAVADLMGLHEREVRVARRTVGKDDARTVADQLLTPPPPPPPPPQIAPAIEDELLTHDVHLPSPRPEMAPSPPPMPTVAESEEVVAWSAGMDSVLQWSWQSGLDLQAVALELGIDLGTLLVRVQTLAAEGRLPSKPPTTDLTQPQSGRHRRYDNLTDPAPEDPQLLFASVSPYA